MSRPGLPPLGTFAVPRALPVPDSRRDHLWRLCGTAFSFACFGLGGVFISLTIFPLIRLVSWNRDVRRRRIQRAMQQTFRLFVWLMTTLGVVSWEVRNRQRLLRPGQLVVANHPTLIDVVLLMSLMPQVDCVVKASLFRNPFLRWPVSWAGYIPNRNSANLIEECAAALRAGRSLIVFPEGTRTIPGEPLKLQRGAAQIALAAGCEVLPVGIACRPLMLTKREPWYRVPPQAGHWVLEVGETIRPADFGHGDGQAMAARRLTRHFGEVFSPHAAASGWTV